MTLRPRYDVAVVGGGHNGLVGAAYLAQSGLRVLVLERLPHTGGAAVSAAPFAGHDVRLSRYSYLVSVMPDRLMAELDLDLRLVSRPTASYTPYDRAGSPGGLLVGRPEDDDTARAFSALTGGKEEYAAWRAFHREVGDLAAVVAPSLLGPLPAVSDLRDRVDPAIWRDLVERPLGEAIERRFADDVVRGVVGTDGLIGTFASLHDPSLAQNRCFLYHVVGNGHGEWRVPVGGMGAVTDALRTRAAAAGAEVLTGAEVSRIGADGDGAEVAWRLDGRDHSVRCRRVLANVAPAVLRGLLGDEADTSAPEGSQLKLNLLLRRLPRLRSGADPRVAFAGTLHLNEGWEQIERAYAQAAAGRLPTEPPGEVYCHTLTDPSILGDAPEGTHTLTYFGLHAPARLFDADPEAAKAEAVGRALASLQQHLAEPLEDCLARDADGDPCVEAKVPQDVERELAMPGGHIFHGDLAWPWREDDAPADTPARRWGVATDRDAVLLCGSGARRGGAVSGLGGRDAAMALLEEGRG